MANPSITALSPAARHSPLIGFFERVPIIAGAAVALFGAVTFSAWALNLPYATRASDGGYPVLPLTALCFLLSGIALTLASLPRRTSTTEAMQQTFAALVATITGLTLYEYLRGSGPGFDTLLFGDAVRQVSGTMPGRIALNTAGSLLLFSLGLLSISHDQRKKDLRSQMFATPGLFIALVGMLGYLFGVKGMYSLSQSSGMALSTSITLLILGVGVLVAVRDRGVAVLLLDEGPAVREELQVQLGDPAARIALAARRHRDRPLPALEREVAGLEGRQEAVAVDEVAGVEAEDRVALELRQPQRAYQLPRDHSQQVREDVVRVLQLDPAEIAGVPADVGEDEATVGDLRHADSKLR